MTTPARGIPGVPSVPGSTRILVTGSRDWTDFAAITAVLRGWRASSAVLVHGGAAGADRMAAAIWRAWGLTVEVHPADWNRHGHGAGYRRNQAMVALGAHVCLAFIRNGSRGATHCAHTAEAAGIPTHRHRRNDQPPDQPQVTPHDAPRDEGAPTRNIRSPRSPRSAATQGEAEMTTAAHKGTPNTDTQDSGTDTQGRHPVARPPLVGARLWTEIVTAAGDRCECTGACGSPHRKGLGRCHHTSASKGGLSVAPGDPLTPLPVAVGLPTSQLRAWCPGCLTSATRTANRTATRTVATPDDTQPGLFGDIA